MVRVQQWSGCIKKRGSSFELNLKQIASLVKVAMGELSGLIGLLNDIDGTLTLVCDTSSSNNHFVKVDMSTCGTKLLGVSFYSTSKQCNCIGFNSYKTELNCKMISADVSQVDEEWIATIKDYFNNKFNLIVTTPNGSPKKKMYEMVRSNKVMRSKSNLISPYKQENGSDEDLCKKEVGCHASTPYPIKH
jgi:hypothetical protein